MNDFEHLAHVVERRWASDVRRDFVQAERRWKALVERTVEAHRRSKAATRVGIALAAGMLVLAATVALVSETRSRHGDGGQGGAPSGANAMFSAPIPAAQTETTEGHELLPTVDVVGLPPAPILASPAPGARVTSAPYKSASPVPNSYVPESQPATAPAPLSPPDLFARANEERRRGDLDAAEADYRRLMRESPSSREALLSHVVLGRMIQAREPHAALLLFERYLDLAGSEMLAEEARASRARLLAKLGRRSDAATAWRELLERHPTTMHRVEAEAALQLLGQGE